MHIISKIGFTALFVASSTLGITPDNASKQTYTATSTPTVVLLSPEWTKQRTIDFIALKASEYNVDSELMYKIIDCESGHNMSSTTIQSRHIRNGIQEQSYGLVQINLPANPDITYEQAIDPEFSIDFLAKQLSKNRGYLWTCYKIVI